jgi:hypothetical protein
MKDRKMAFEVISEKLTMPALPQARDFAIAITPGIQTNFLMVLPF